MLIKAVHKYWVDKAGKSLEGTEKGVELEMGDFHSGTVFNGELYLDTDNEMDLKQALRDGYHPVFEIAEENVSFQQVLNVEELVRNLLNSSIADELDTETRERMARMLKKALEV